MGTNDAYDNNMIKRWTRKIHLKENIFQLKRFTFPINISNWHWTLTGINFNFKKVIEYFDSMGDLGINYLNVQLKVLSDEHEDKLSCPLPEIDSWSTSSCGDRVPQEPNAFDCGVYACIFAKASSRDLYPTNISQIVKNPREKLIQLISESQLTKCKLSN